MLNGFKASLPARAWLAVILIATLAFSSASSSVLISLVSENDAAAINTAGSLRMATYNLNWQLEANAKHQVIHEVTQDLQARLNSPELQSMVGDDLNTLLAQSLARIKRQWQEDLLPTLERSDAAAFKAKSASFIDNLQIFVQQLQHKSETRQNWQKNIQGAALLLTVLILLVGMYELQYNVLTPLQELVSATERFRAGDLHARIEYRSQDELGQMADSFNAMAAVIEESHRTLEQRVAEKTQDLEQSKAALELLYQASRSVTSEPVNAERLDLLIDSFQQRLPGLRLSLCLKGNTPESHILALHGQSARDFCTRSSCDNCQYHTKPISLMYNIRSQGISFGEMRAHFDDGHAPHIWEQELIQALTDLIGTALSLERQREQDNRLLLLEERTIIARELHDSLAQALSYMKLQVTRLQTLMRRGESGDLLLEVSEELREGLNSAYRQLRELLNTFRLQIQDGGIEPALRDTTREFAERGALRIHLHSAPLAFTLSAPEQIHVLQITREALSNCVRHAQATQTWIHLRQCGEEVELLIEDDGIGIDPDFDSRHHHGLNIMQERARSLGGNLTVSRRESRGTRVRLLFCPEFLHQPTSEALT